MSRVTGRALGVVIPGYEAPEVAVHGARTRGSPTGRAGAGDGFWLWVLLRLLVIALLLALAVHLGRGLFHTFGFAPPEPAPPVRAAPGPRVVRGVVVSPAARGVGSPFAGEVGALHVREGQRVTRGQALFEMDVSGARRAAAAARERGRLAAREVRRLRARRAAEVGDLRKQQAAIEKRIRRARRAAVAAEAARGAGPFGADRGGQSVLLPDPELVGELEASRSALWALYADRQRAGHLAVVAAMRRGRAARAEAERLEAVVRGARRVSPISGVVTSVRTRAGAWIEARRPVVRADDPTRYQVAALVPGEPDLVRGSLLVIRAERARAAAVLESVRPAGGGSCSTPGCG